jgi:hypothetical protein
MATNDMITALDGLDSIDWALQSRITGAILSQFNDQVLYFAFVRRHPHC